MRTRNWSIRAKIISLLLVPLVTLVVMWALATAVTLGPGLDLLHTQRNLENVGRPARALLAQVQAERKLSVTYLAGGRHDATSLTAQRAETDAALATFRQLADGPDAPDPATDPVRTRVVDLVAELASIDTLRTDVDRGTLDRASAAARYTDILDTGFRLQQSLVQVADTQLAQQAAALVGLDRGRELLAQEDTAVSGALAAGGFDAAELSRTVQLIGAERFAFAENATTLPDDARQDYQQLVAGAELTRFATLENTILAQGRAGAPVPVAAATWHNAYDRLAAELAAFSAGASDRLVALGTPSSLAIFGNIALTGLLGLATVVITVYASIRIARSLIKRLAGLRQAAQELAVDRLPRVVARLRHGEQVDVDSEAPALPYGDDEIGQVGHAFNELQRTAVNSAIEEANVRRGLNEVFLNIARRSQTLLHRQLSILDRMERRADDPTELEDLFRVDHLATRMRRHAEDLVILAGAAPGRGWRNPVPVVDVLRGAVSEVEDYARVTLRPMPDLAIAGRAVGDVIHLLAELIENATSFSPPHTKVNVGGERVTHGFAIEIEDRGLGMSAQALADANARLSDPPDFDPANSAQLGLFVVARLAERHGVKVQLRSSPYGGITAVALMPDDLIVPDGDRGPDGPREVVAALPAGRHGDTNGSSRYREIATAARPAITATVRSAPTPDANPGVPTPPRTGPVTASPAKASPTKASPAKGTAAKATPVEATPVEATPVDPPPRQRRSRATPPRHARQEVIEAPASAGPDGLPRRVRQTSLAPQLRNEPTDAVVADELPTPPAPSRSPEQLRAMMTSFQSGMNRGRREADVDAFDENGGGTPERDQQ